MKKTGSSGRAVLGKGAPPQSNAPAQQAKQFPLFKLVRVLALGVPQRASSAAHPETGNATVAREMVGSGVTSSNVDSSHGHASTDAPTNSEDVDPPRRRAASFFKSISFATGIPEPEPANVQQPLITVCASAGCVGHAFLAVYCSNDQLLLRYAGDSGFPIVRAIPWFRDPGRRILSFDFNPTAEWLVCACADSSIYLVPVFALLIGHNEDNDFGGIVRSIPSAPNGAPEKTVGYDWFGRLPSLMNYALDPSAGDGSELGGTNDITLVWPAGRGFRGNTSTTCCIWWRTWGGLDLCITSSNSGVLSVFDLRQKTEAYTIRLKNPISKLELVEDAVQSYRYLLIHTPSSGYWKLLLEQQNDEYHMFDTLLTQNGKPPFSPVPLQRFSQNIRLSLQRNKQGHVISAFHSSSNKFEVFDPELNKYALFVYQLFADVQHLHLTDRFVFTTSPSPYDTTRFSVVSNNVAGTSANPLYFYKQLKESIMQEFKLGVGETVLQLLRAFPISRMMMDKYRTDRASLNELPLEGCIVVTNRAVYELRQHIPPEVVFFGLLAQSKDKSQAELLGKTVGLDMFQLYETAADQQFRDGQYEKALDLYLLSNIRTSKLIDIFLRIDRTDVVLDRLLKIISQPDAVAMSEKKRYADIIFRIYVQRLLSLARGRPASTSLGLVAPVVSPPTVPVPTTPTAEKATSTTTTAPSSSSATAPTATSPEELVSERDLLNTTEQEFRAFLLQNPDYDSGVAVMELIKHGWADLFFEVAHIRRIMHVALNILVNRGAVYISRAHLKFLQKHNYIEALKQCSGGVLLRCLPPNDQVDVILTQHSSVLNYTSNILSILPHLDHKRLRKLASFFDSTLRQRQNPTVSSPSSTNSASPPASSTATTTTTTSTSTSSSSKVDTSGTSDSPTAVPLRVEELNELYLNILLRLSLHEVHARQQHQSSSDKQQSSEVQLDHRRNRGTSGATAKLNTSPSSSSTTSRNVPNVTPGRRADRLLAARPGSERNKALVTTIGSSSVSPIQTALSTGDVRSGNEGVNTAATAEPVSDDNDMPVTNYFYTQQRTLLGSYRVTILLSLCLQLKHWDAAAELYEILHDWPQSLQFRLQALAQNVACAGMISNKAEESHLALTIAESLLNKMRGQCHPIAPLLFTQTLLNYWFERQHQASRLQSFLQEHLDILAVPLGAFLAICKPNNSASDESSKSVSSVTQVLRLFGSQFYLTITKKRLQLLRDQQQRDIVNRVPQDRLWSEIKLNLEKDLDKRTKIMLPSGVLLQRSDTVFTADSSDKDLLVFTCGHHFFRREFLDSILPEFRRRLELFPIALPLTTKVFITDYYQAQMHLACPLCLYNGLRQDAQKSNPNLITDKVKNWAI